MNHLGVRGRILDPVDLPHVVDGGPVLQNRSHALTEAEAGPAWQAGVCQVENPPFFYLFQSCSLSLDLFFLGS